MSILPDDYKYFERMLAEKCGMELGSGKEYLLESRLQPVLADLGCKTFSELVFRLRYDLDPRALCSVIELMTTNETLFFRDSSPFEVLKKTLLPQLLEARKDRKRLSIWSAACSTGQEPYSIAMLLSSLGTAVEGWQTEILATDLCKKALERAKEGVYSQFEVQRGLPPEMLQKNFVAHQQGWQVRDEIKKRVTFRELNLIEPFSHIGRFDIIFCRNVLIYFGVEAKKKTLEKMAAVLEPDGHLFLGGAETVLGITEAFERLNGETASVYKKTNTP